MDASITKSFTTYKLVNNETGNVEADGLGRIRAMDEQNHLWARGVKCSVVPE